MQPQSLYDILGVSRENISQITLKRAFLVKARVCHPDRFVTCEESERLKAEGLFKTVKDAYDILNDSSLKAAYDAALLKGPEVAFSEVDIVRQKKVYDSHLRPSQPDAPVQPRKRGRPPGSSNVAKLAKTTNDSNKLKEPAPQQLSYSSQQSVESVPVLQSTTQAPPVEDAWAAFPIGIRKMFFDFSLAFYIPRDCPHRVQHLAPGDFRELPQSVFDAYCRRFFKGVVNPNEIPLDDRNIYLNATALTAFKHRYGSLVLLDAAVVEAKRAGASGFMKRLADLGFKGGPSWEISTGWCWSAEEDIRLLVAILEKHGLTDGVSRCSSDEFLWPRGCIQKRPAFKNFLDARLRWLIAAIVGGFTAHVNPIASAHVADVAIEKAEQQQQVVESTATETADKENASTQA